ncbi:MAG: M23 family metallopeptidase, partial [Clostridiales bacterium]|nr:M23 family metallopeptidase [Clostridiales bacterium]
IAAFLGLSGIPADDKKTDPTGKESNEETDSEKVRRDAVAVAVQKYIETHNQREMPSDRLGTFPLNGMITSYFSTRQNPFYQVGAGEDAFEFHSGIDISAAISTDILSYRDGIVSRVTYSKSYGNYLIITHNDELETLYAHCDNILVKEGDTVKEGQHIAVAGSTGRSTARHLHFEIRIRGKAVDPLPYLPGKGAVLG